MIVAALILAAFIGLSLGVLGSGGSIVTLPVLVYVAGIPPHEAVGMSLLIVGVTSSLGSLVRLRRGDFDLRAAGFFSLTGILGAFGGAKFTHLVSGRVLLILFGVLMLVIGLRMLCSQRQPNPTGKCRPLRCLVIGFAVGLLTGFLGVGGGFIILPALVLFAGLEMKVANGTSLAVIAVNSFAGLLGQFRFLKFEWLLTVAFVGTAGIGLVGGLFLAQRLPSATLLWLFGWIVVALGAFLLIENSLFG